MTRLSALCLLLTLLCACAPAAGLPTATSTSTATYTQTPSSTLTPTITETPTVTLTPTPEATATPELVEINTKFDSSVDLYALPVHNFEELTSGKLAWSEKQLVESTGIKFPETVSVLSLRYDADSKENIGIVIMLEGPGGSQYPFTSSENVPFKGISANMFDIQGTRVLVLGFLWLNGDGTTGIVHIGVQNWQSQGWLPRYQELYTSNRNLGVVAKIGDNKNFQFLDWVDYMGNQVILETYEDNGVREELIKQWADTSKVPPELENLLFVAIFPHWR